MSNRGQGLDLVPLYRIIPERSGGGAVMIMRDATYRMVLRVGAVNFDMRSPVEQRSITFGFGEMLSGLTPDFPIQIFSHTKLLDAEAYLRQFQERAGDARTPAPLRALIQDHVNHIQTQIMSRNLLQREFYVVLSYGDDTQAIGIGTMETMPGASIAKALFGMVERKVLRTPDQLDIDVAVGQLDLRAAQVQGALDRIEISSHRLGEVELIGLLRELFNPGSSDRRTVSSMHSFDQAMPALPADMLGSPPPLDPRPRLS